MKVSYVTEAEFDSEDFDFSEEIVPERFNITGLTRTEIDTLLVCIRSAGIHNSVRFEDAATLYVDLSTTLQSTIDKIVAEA